ncbi:MAG: hypothetical protein JWM44_3172 [Bacilli bacterium]|nr:hypothetical protein [Bacilli bacterium]
MHNHIRLFLRSPFFVFSLILLLKIMMTHTVIFGFEGLWACVITGLPSVWVVFGLIEWLTRKRKWLKYVIVDLVMTAIYFAAIMYYQYYGVIVTYHALRQINQVTEVKGSVFYLLHPYFLLIFLDVVVFGLLFFFRKKTRSSGKPNTRFIRYGAATLTILSVLICTAFIWPHRESMNELRQAEEMGILNYEMHAFFGDQKEPLVQAIDITAEEIAKLKGIELKADGSPISLDYWKAADGRNVIVIQLEAFQNFLIGLKVDGKEITPVMNKLMQDSLYFPNMFQQVGQGNTADAEFIVNTSFYVPPNGAATDEYTNKLLPSLPRLFDQKGYRTTTFHTNEVKFWNRKQLYKALGFDRYYDKTFFGDIDTVKFAASDEVLYDKTAAEMTKIQQSGQPFYAQVISMSGHHPFDLPARKVRISLPDRYQDSFVGNYLIAQNYADYALGLFIEKLKQEHVWENSLFVIYGDHMGLPIYSLSSQDKILLQEIYGKDYTYAEMMNIPLIINAPGVTKPAILYQVGGQVDIMPTIANLVGISLQNNRYFGQDLLNVKHNILPEHYYLPTGSFINDNTIFVPGNGFADGEKFPLTHKSLQETNASEDEYERAKKLFSMSNIYVKQLPKHD